MFGNFFKVQKFWNIFFGVMGSSPKEHIWTLDALEINILEIKTYDTHNSCFGKSCWNNWFFENTRSSNPNFNISKFLTIIFKYSKSTSKSQSYLKFQQIIPSFFFPFG